MTNNKFLLFLLLPMLVNSKTVYLDSNNSLSEYEKIKNSITIQKPEKRNWDELKLIYSNEVTNKTGIKFLDCINKNSKDLTHVGSYSQNILYNDYEWNLYKNKDNYNCIELINPVVGFLNIQDAEALISASNGVHFEKLGFWNEADEYAKNIASHLPECENDIVNIETQKQKNIVVRKDIHPHIKAQLGSAYLKDDSNNELKIESNKMKEKHHNDLVNINSMCIDKSDHSSFNENENLFSNGIIGNESRINVPKSNYRFMAFLIRKQGTPTTDCKLTGTGFYINQNTILTAAHNIKYLSCTNTKWRVKTNNINQVAQKSKITSQWRNNPGSNFLLSDHVFDYGALKTNHELLIPLYPALFWGPLFPIDPTLNDVGLSLGFPHQINGQVVNDASSTGNLFAEERSVLDELTVLDDTGSDPLISHYFDQTAGQSGGPLAFTHNPKITAPIIGVFSVITSSNNYATSTASNLAHSNIVQWANEVPPNVIININSPNYLETIDWNSIANNTFSATANSTTRTAIQKDINSNLVWESDINGIIGNGDSLTALEAKSKLRSGYNVVKLTIDTPKYSGEDYIQFYITGPEGSFTMPSTYCILNLQNNPNNCNIPISWQTTNSPNTIVYNNRTNSTFATSPQGNNVPFTAVKNQDTELVLYASTDKVYDIDKVNVSAKTPTGNLTNNSPICSLQPSPIDPLTGQSRDPNATPPGCGSILSWSNVKWASPSIFYKLVGSSTWHHLYQIPCELNGETCSGSIDTDDISPELIPANGVEFKLLQFDNLNSGLLSNPFTVTAHRYADIYEFDDGGFNGVQGSIMGLTNNIEIGVTQINHTFHRPAVYDPETDIDTFNIPTNNFNEGQFVEVIIHNMSSNLQVGFDVKCAGIKQIDNGEPLDGVWDFPTTSIASSIYNSELKTTIMKYRNVKELNYVINNTTPITNVQLNCVRTRVILNREVGTPSENLSYDIVVNDPANTVTPALNSAQPVCKNNYCIRLLGSDFDATASVQVRENISGSSILETYSGNDIYTRSDYQGQERLQFPIRNLIQQDKFNNNGLCFKVVNTTATSNEKCLVRPVTADQGPFMGETLESYSATQDKEHTSYVVVGGGNHLKIWGNSWKKINYNYMVTPSTMLEFEFRSNQQEAEINGIGFIMQGGSKASSTRSWKVYGTQNDWGNRTYDNYTGTGWKTYRIPIGQTFTGQVAEMVFIADEDNPHVGQNTSFYNPVLYEAPDAYDDVPNRRAYDDNNPGDAVPIFNGANAQLHNFYVAGDEDWTIFSIGDGDGIDINSIQIGSASARLTMYRVDGSYTEIAPGRWDITRSDLTQIDSDHSSGNNTVTAQNTTGSIQAYVVLAKSSGAYGSDTNYHISATTSNTLIIDAYDDVPSQRAYNDNNPGDAVPISNGASAQVHNFHVAGDEDWTIFSIGNGDGVDINTVKIGSVATELTLYRVDGAYTEIAPGRWDITRSDLTEIDSDHSGGNNSVTAQNVTGSIQAYVVLSESSGTYGDDTNYSISVTSNNPVIDQYDDVPSQRAYNDNNPGDAVPISNGATAQVHNFHVAGDEDWTIFSIGNGDGVDINTVKIGSVATELTLYRVDGAYTEIAPGRWDITRSDLTEIDSDHSGGNNSVTAQNVTGSIQAYVVLSESSGTYGDDTNYSISVTSNNPTIDQYDDVPSQRAYNDNNPGDAVPVSNGASAQVHNFHVVDDEDWTIFSIGHGDGVDINTIQNGSVATRLTLYRVDGFYTEIAPGRWDITRSDLTEIDSDHSGGNNSVTAQNVTGSIQAYVVLSESSGTYGDDTNYSIYVTSNNPVIDQYDDVPSQRAYNDNNPGDAVPIFNGASAQLHNFHVVGDEDWTIFSIGHGDGLNISTIQIGVASAKLTLYRVDGVFTEIAPARWDITRSDLTQIDSDTSSGNNSVSVQNTTGEVQAYVIKTTSAGIFGSNTNYHISVSSN